LHIPAGQVSTVHGLLSSQSTAAVQAGAPPEPVVPPALAVVAEPVAPPALAVVAEPPAAPEPAVAADLAPPPPLVVALAAEMSSPLAQAPKIP
jgi:hypothetical protein